MPFLLFLLSVATLVAVSSKSKAAGGGHAQTFTLDANMPESLRNQVLAALVSGTDPNAIDAFATAIQAQYPLAAGLLHAKATALRTGVPALPAASTDPGGPPLDATMPASMVAFVHTELLNETDPNKLVALANTLAGQYPIASGLLAQRAAVLNVQPNAPAVPANPQPVVQPQPQPTPSPVPGSSASNPSAPALTIPGLDPGIPADLAQAVMTELATDTDPNKLQTYAQEIQSQYPMAASLLSAKANSLIALAQSLTPPTAAAPPVTPVTPVYPSVPVTPPSVPINPVVPVIAPAGPSGSMLGMDANMPPQTVQLVVSELANEQDPTKLQALAAQLAPQYPIAAGLLNTRANLLLAMQPPATVVPSPSPTPTTVASTYTVQQDDYPWKIAAHFTGHGARWPELVAANPQKTKGKDGNFTSLLPGEKLALPSTWTPPQNGAAGAIASTNGTNGSSVPMVAPAVIHGPEVPAPSPSPSSALDPGIPANVASSVLAAVKTGTDPAQLRGFASALSKEGFPIAAALLNAKANMLNPTPPVTPAPGATTPGASPGATPAATPASASPVATYKVKSGDSPSKIAHALIHDGNRWPELIAANPQKKRAKDGNFASLQPGEVLQLPASWASAAPSASRLPQGGA